MVKDANWKYRDGDIHLQNQNDWGVAANTKQKKRSDSTER